MQPLRVPACLQQVDADELENYIDLRMRQLFNALFNVRPDLQTAITSQDMHKALSIIPKAVYNTSQFEQRELQLLFRHDCL